MIDRIVEIAETSASLKVRNKLLIISRPEAKEVTVPVSEIGILLLSNSAISLTQPVISTLMAAGGLAVFCDNRHLPAGMAIPLASSFIQTERFTLQANAPLPVKKRIWQQLVRAKITFQAELLKLLHSKDLGLSKIAQKVRSGDPENVEAQAAQRYWKNLFGDNSFRRNRELEDQNKLLNYGYMILRAAVARAVCAAGLHPSFGLHHHNRYDQFCLASDLMEPFRPLVDKVTAGIVSDKGKEAPLDRETKALLAGTMESRVKLDGDKVTVFQALFRLASSLVSSYKQGKGKVFLPESLFPK